MRVKLFENLSEAKSTLQNNEPRLVVAGNIHICIVRRDDQLIAFKNECPHMGERLHTGMVNHLAEIVCPLHSFRFNLITGEESEQRCSSLVFVRVTDEKEGVFLISS